MTVAAQMFHSCCCSGLVLFYITFASWATDRHNNTLTVHKQPSDFVIGVIETYTYIVQSSDFIKVGYEHHLYNIHTGFVPCTFQLYTLKGPVCPPCLWRSVMVYAIMYLSLHTTLVHFATAHVNKCTKLHTGCVNWSTLVFMFPLHIMVALLNTKTPLHLQSVYKGKEDVSGGSCIVVVRHRTQSTPQQQ